MRSSPLPNQHHVTELFLASTKLKILTGPPPPGRRCRPSFPGEQTSTTRQRDEQMPGASRLRLFPNLDRCSWSSHGYMRSSVRSHVPCVPLRIVARILSPPRHLNQCQTAWGFARSSIRRVGAASHQATRRRLEPGVQRRYTTYSGTYRDAKRRPACMMDTGFGLVASHRQTPPSHATPHRGGMIGQLLLGASARCNERVPRAQSARGTGGR